MCALDTQGVQYTISVPFERLAQLKAKIEKRRYWHRAGRDVGLLESYCKPNC